MTSSPFSPLRLRNLTLPNRFIKAATHDGASLTEMAHTYVRLAQHGVGLVTVAYVSIDAVDKTFDNQHHICEANVEEWSAFVRRVRAAGTHLSAQLHHPGLFCMSSDGVPRGPSLFWLPSKFAWPRILSLDDLEELKAKFVSAAELCVRAGFSCIELQCAHGYLLSQFLTPIINRRNDGYGGDVMGRARFPCEIVEAIRAAHPSVPILVKLNGDDGFVGGLRLSEAVVVARLLTAAGADAIIPSYGYTSLNGFGMLRGSVPLQQMADAMPKGSKTLTRVLGRFLVPTIPFESLFLRDIATAFVKALEGTSGSVIYVGGVDSLSAAQEVLSIGCVGMQLARPLIREPWFVEKLKKAFEDAATDDQHKRGAASKSLCIQCNRCTLAAIDPVKFPAGCPLLSLPEESPRGARREGDHPGVLLDDIEDIQ